MFKAIVACDRNWAIGKGNRLLCHLPGDLQYFKEKTLGKRILVGRKTLDSFPGGRPLRPRAAPPAGCMIIKHLFGKKDQHLFPCSCHR